MTRVWVSVGSNIEPEQNVRAAIAALRDKYGELCVSTVYRTEAVGFAGRPFLNLVAGFDTTEPPAEVLACLRATEDARGRERRTAKFSSRTLDLDLLLYGDVCGEVAGKRLPHPDVLAYPFVLGPLAELAPAQRHPVDGRSFAELWRAMQARGEGGSMVKAPLEGLEAGGRCAAPASRA